MLEAMGVELKMGFKVVGVDASGVDVEDRDGNRSHLAARTTIWAAGVQASPLAAQLAASSGAEVDRAGRIKVLPDLTLPGHPEVFVVGDMTSLHDLPGVAEVAMQGGLHAANSIVRNLKGKPTVPFKYRDLGSVAAVGRFRAIASIRGLRLSGFPGWFVWMFVHLAFLEGFGNRLSTMLRWLPPWWDAGEANGSSAWPTWEGTSACPTRSDRSSSQRRSRWCPRTSRCRMDTLKASQSLDDRAPPLLHH